MARNTNMMVDDGGGATPFFAPGDIEWAKSVAANPSGFSKADLLKAFNILNANGMSSLANLIPQVNDVIDQTNDLAGTDIDYVDNPFTAQVDNSGNYGDTGFSGGSTFTGDTGGSTGSTVTSDSSSSSSSSGFDWQSFISQWNASQAKIAADAKAAAEEAAKKQRESAWAVLQNEFARYGLGELVNVVKDEIIRGASYEEQLLKLRQSNVYKTRFAANDARINNGLRALSEAEYVQLEDAYSGLMRKYGLPEWYTAKGAYGKQAGLEQFIANDVSPAEMEDRIQLAVNRIQQGPKEVLDTLRNFYPGISNGDILAYVLDPKKALPVLQRQVTNAEIGGEAVRYGLTADLNRADELAGLGVNQAQARQGYQTIGGGLERGRALSDIYSEPNYDQRTAESEVFGTNDATDAAKRRRKLIDLETSTFGGSSGIRGGALDANRAGTF